MIIEVDLNPVPGNKSGTNSGLSLLANVPCLDNHMTDPSIA
jgi:hypothetical protein